MKQREVIIPPDSDRYIISLRKEWKNVKLKSISIIMIMIMSAQKLWLIEV